MSAINLDKSIESLKKCYKGTHEISKEIVLDKSLIDDLEFSFAISRVKMAIDSEEISINEFNRRMKK